MPLINVNQNCLEPKSIPDGQSLFTKPSILLNRLQSMLTEALPVEESTDADVLASTSFAAILKISLHVEAFWHDFKDANVCSTLLRRLALECPRLHLRRRTAEYIKAICFDLQLYESDRAEVDIVLIT